MFDDTEIVNIAGQPVCADGQTGINSQLRLHPRVKARANLRVADGVGVNAVVVGVTIDGVEVEFGGDEVDAVLFAIGEALEHELDDAVLDALPAPAWVFVLVVGVMWVIDSFLAYLMSWLTLLKSKRRG
jgi:hypothetical protein